MAEAEMKKCKKCGTEVEKKIRKCPTCGAPLATAVNIISLVILLAGLGLSVIVALLPDSDEKKEPITSTPTQSVTNTPDLNSYPKLEDGILTQIIPNPNSKDFPSPDASDLPPGGYAVVQFMNTWLNNDWVEMAEHTQQHWLARQVDPIGTLAAYFDDDEVVMLGAEVKGFKDGPVVDEPGLSGIYMRDFDVEVYYAFKPLVITETLTVKVVNEGCWGVNPISVLPLRGLQGVAMDAYAIQKALGAISEER
jgi:hypothetical protein